MGYALVLLEESYVRILFKEMSCAFVGNVVVFCIFLLICKFIISTIRIDSGANNWQVDHFYTG